MATVQMLLTSLFICQYHSSSSPFVVSFVESLLMFATAVHPLVQHVAKVSQGPIMERQTTQTTLTWYNLR